MQKLLLTLTVLIFSFEYAQSATLTVGKGGGFDHSTITSAMAAAGQGDTLLVEGGVYDTTGGEVYPIRLKNEVKLKTIDSDSVTVMGDGQSSILEGFQLDGFNMNNFIITNGGGLHGGGLYLAVNSEASITDCTFTGNAVTYNQDIENSGYGHAVHLDDSSLSVRRCFFLENGILDQPVDSFAGWAVAAIGPFSPSHLVLTETILDGNSGGIVCRDQSVLVLVNSLLVRNRFQSHGSLGSAISFQSSGMCDVNGCTLAGNLDGGIHLGSAASARIENSILWNYGREIFGSSPVVASCCIRGGFQGLGVLTVYPEFVDPGAGDWRLSDGSPLIDRGATALIRNGVTMDLDGNDRVRGDSVDIGAYEAPSEFTASPGDTTPERLYVRQATAEAKTGRSWEDPFPTLWEALLESHPGGEIWVASGTYRETVSLIPEISLIGGFQGNETEIEERDLSAYQTVIDATGLDRSVIGASELGGFMVDGFILTGGRTVRGGGFAGSNGSGSFRNCGFHNNYAQRQGGAVYSSRVGLDFVNCEFIANQVMGIRPESGGITDGDGGGIYLIMGGQGGLSLQGCLFKGNKASWTGMCITISAPSSGGGSVTLEDCILIENSNYGDIHDSNVISSNREIDFNLYSTVISHNSATADFPFLDANVIGSRNGGGIVNVTLVDSEISYNSGMRGIEAAEVFIQASTIAYNDLDGLLVQGGVVEESNIIGNGHSGISNQFTVPEFRILNTTIAGNGKGKNPFPFQAFGSGIGLRAERIVLSGCRIFDNVGLEGPPGGGTLEGVQVTVTNTEVFGNLAQREFNAVGGMEIRGDTIEVVNCTFADNRKEPFKFGDFTDLNVGANQSLRLVNTIVYNASPALTAFGGDEVIEFSNLSDVVTGEGNISVDPQFIHPWDGSFADLRLSCGSPCVDAGTLEGAPSLDIEGTTRPRGAGVDMGAYENCHFDVNGDRSEDVLDLLSFSPEWYQPTDETNFGFDLNRSGVSRDRIDRLDLDELLEALNDS